MGRFTYGMNVSLDVPIDLDLLEQRSFQQGVTLHRYAPRDVREAGPC